MGDAADDAYESAMRQEAWQEDFIRMVHAACEAPIKPRPCELVPTRADDPDYDYVCTICGKHFVADA